MLKIQDLTVFVPRGYSGLSANNKKILNNLSFRFEKGKIYALMGPNGSGKSTLAQAIMGNPAYSLSRNSRIDFRGQSIKGLKPEKRARLGLFLSFQSPLSLSGVSVLQLLRYALVGKIDVLRLQEKVRALAKDLKIPGELLERSLNEGFSGGEKKKLEVLQAVILNPSLLIFDEIDTGVDVDSLRLIAGLLGSLKKQGKTLILITHYNRILKYLRPDKVFVMVGGWIVKTGDYKLAGQVEKYGYEKF